MSRNGTESSRRPTTLADLVPHAAATAPDDGGLVGLDTALTWSVVDAQTSAIASRLVSAGIVPGDRVAVARRKGHESIVAVHGILRAGAVVVPIDPLAPAHAVRRVLADARVSGVVGDVRTVRNIEPWSIGGLDLSVVIVAGDADGALAAHDPLDWNAVIVEPSDALLPDVSPADMAYIIFTSGSTGRPKGIVHTHRSAMAYATRAVEEYGLSTADRIAGMNPLHFDMSTLELYAAPLAGATVVVMAEPHLQFPAGLTQRSEEQDVTVWYTVPFLLRSVVERGGLDRRPLPKLRSILYGGEPYAGAALTELMRSVPQAEVVNVYGPAEVNACTHHHLSDPDEVPDDVPIGRPWADAEVRVVDEDGDDVADGEPGELLVSTPTVMSRYWELDELTAARLRPDAVRPSWYATGDIVTRDDTGLLRFRGRRDHQVKIRGVRLELEAIENVLTDAPQVLHAVAGPNGASGDAANIVAAVVLHDGAAVTVGELQRWCRERLPSVAVPQSIQFRTDFPPNATGKIDAGTVRLELVKLVATTGFDEPQAERSGEDE